MDVIRHQNKRVNVITVPVELQQTNLEFRAHFRPPHVASTHPGIEPLLHSVGKARFVVALFVSTPWRRMQSQSNSAFVPPLTEKWLRH